MKNIFKIDLFLVIAFSIICLIFISCQDNPTIWVRGIPPKDVDFSEYYALGDVCAILILKNGGLQIIAHDFEENFSQVMGITAKGQRTYACCYYTHKDYPVWFVVYNVFFKRYGYDIFGIKYAEKAKDLPNWVKCMFKGYYGLGCND